MFINYLGRATALLAVAGSLAGCATITRGVHESWTVKTEPPGASVQTSIGGSCDSTPCTFRLKRKSDFDVTITKAGYQTAVAKVGHKTSRAGQAALLGNAVFGGVIGAFTDATNGATMDLKPNPLVVTLTPETAALAPTARAAPPADASAAKP
jgi:hypothetical protein